MRVRAAHLIRSSADLPVHEQIYLHIALCISPSSRNQKIPNFWVFEAFSGGNGTSPGSSSSSLRTENLQEWNEINMDILPRLVFLLRKAIWNYQKGCACVRNLSFDKSRIEIGVPHLESSVLIVVWFTSSQKLVGISLDFPKRVLMIQVFDKSFVVQENFKLNKSTKLLTHRLCPFECIADLLPGSTIDSLLFPHRQRPVAAARHSEKSVKFQKNRNREKFMWDETEYVQLPRTL